MAGYSTPADDEAVQSTNDDATQSKKFAVVCVLTRHAPFSSRYAAERGYWSDNYISYFCRGSVDKRTPEICRGYYARVKCIQLLLFKFLRLTSCDCQVINLGAGFDTMYWTLCELELRPKLYVDVDFSEVTNKKCHMIKYATRHI